MHLNAETYHTMFLSPAEMGELRREIPDLTALLADSDVPLERYPRLITLLEALVNDGYETTDHHVPTEER